MSQRVYEEFYSKKDFEKWVEENKDKIDFEEIPRIEYNLK